MIDFIIQFELIDKQKNTALLNIQLPTEACVFLRRLAPSRLLVGPEIYGPCILRPEQGQEIASSSFNTASHLIFGDGE